MHPRRNRRVRTAGCGQLHAGAHVDGMGVKLATRCMRMRTISVGGYANLVALLPHHDPLPKVGLANPVVSGAARRRHQESARLAAGPRPRSRRRGARTDVMRPSERHPVRVPARSRKRSQRPGRTMTSWWSAVPKLGPRLRVSRLVPLGSARPLCRRRSCPPYTPGCSHCWLRPSSRWGSCLRGRWGSYGELHEHRSTRSARHRHGYHHNQERQSRRDL